MKRKSSFLFFLLLFCFISLTSCSYSHQSVLEPIKGDSLWINESKDSFYMNQYSYSGKVTPKKRFIALGFDDFRSSDFSLIIPLLNKYGAKAEFNRIHYSTSVTDDEMALVNMVLNGGHELGDHTWKHYSYIFDSPMFNGQNPDSPEGNQKPFPTNSQLRDDVGGGRNVFGHLLSDSLKVTLGSQSPKINNVWGKLSDDECQYFREYFSVMKDNRDFYERTPFLSRFVEKDDNSHLIELLDELSNKYLGTTGNSNGSWDEFSGCYTGGIFTGCKTSANHEIWERILLITKLFVKDNFGIELHTWSWPGSKKSFCEYPYNGKYYYDSEHKLLFNNIVKFQSSHFKNKIGEYVSRSWTDVLKQLGYYSTHDAIFPGRRDGQTLPCMSYQYIMNASQSRPDALIYPTNRSIDYSIIANEFGKEQFKRGKDGLETQMYDAGGSFYDAIEKWRKCTANGIIWGEVIDSEDTWSEKVILEGLLKYGKAAGIEFITKSEAYDICFNHSLTEGNLIYNPEFKNTAREFLPNAKNVPANPDGYDGDCRVVEENGSVVLITNGITSYDHFGIPYGEIRYKANIKGRGTIKIRFIKNDTAIDSIGSSEVVLEKEVNSINSYSLQNMDIFIPDNQMAEYELKCAGWGNKIIGIRIEYSDGLQIKEIGLYKKNNYL